MRRERAKGSSAAPNGKRRLAGDTARAATSDEVKTLRGAASKRQSRRFCLHLWIEPNRFSYLSRIRRGARHGKSYL